MNPARSRAACRCSWWRSTVFQTPRREHRLRPARAGWGGRTDGARQLGEEPAALRFALGDVAVPLRARHAPLRPQRRPVRTLVGFLVARARDVLAGRPPREPARYLPYRAARYALASACSRGERSSRSPTATTPSSPSTSTSRWSRSPPVHGGCTELAAVRRGAPRCRGPSSSSTVTSWRPLRTPTIPTAYAWSLLLRSGRLRDAIRTIGKSSSMLPGT
jgi:hypothetical protein